jgi:UDP-GlcNAc:undecaprenyl-phosphate/decaprenyl-phosphate GlcNAc-1-phosphate transferase
MNDLFIQLPILFLAMTLGLLVVPAVIDISRRGQWLDRPDQRKWHTAPTPATGGIGVLLVMAIVMLILPQGRAFIAKEPFLFFGYILLAIVGITDDRVNLSPRMRFVLQLLLASAIAFSGHRITHLGGLFGLDLLPLAAQYTLTVLVIVGLTNAFNLVDGIDGLAGTMGVYILSVLILLGGWRGLQGAWPMQLALAGALLIFLQHNWRPAKVFLGDGGSLPIGFTLAVSGVMLMGHADQMPVLERGRIVELLCALFMGPVMDTLRVFADRIAQGRSPFSPDRNHLHHWFLKNLRTAPQAVITILIVQVATLVITYLLHGTLSTTVIVLFQALVQVMVLLALRLAWDLRRSYRMVRTLERIMG